MILFVTHTQCKNYGPTKHSCTKAFGRARFGQINRCVRKNKRMVALNKNAKLMLWQWVYMIDVLVWQRKNQGEKRWHERWHRIISQTRIAAALTFKIKQLADSLVQITLPTILDKPFDISQSQRTRSHAHASSSPYFRLKASSTKAYYVHPIIDTVHKIF